MATDAGTYLKRYEYPRFSQAEEEQLAEQAHAGCVESRNQLVLSQVLWVLNVVHRKWHYDIDDAVGEALLRLVASIDGFNPAKGRLTTYTNFTAWTGACESDRSFRRVVPVGTVRITMDDNDDYADRSDVERVASIDIDDAVRRILERVADKFGSHVGQICEMRLCQSKTYKEIGESLGVSKQCVGEIWLRIRKFLKTVL
jgi:RNA polymerase sigma factor (sigma-70 family)